MIKRDISQQISFHKQRKIEFNLLVTSTFAVKAQFKLRKPTKWVFSTWNTRGMFVVEFRRRCSIGFWIRLWDPWNHQKIKIQMYEIEFLVILTRFYCFLVTSSATLEKHPQFSIHRYTFRQWVSFHDFKS